MGRLRMIQIFWTPPYNDLLGTDSRTGESHFFRQSLLLCLFFLKNKKSGAVQQLSGEGRRFCVTKHSSAHIMSYCPLTPSLQDDVTHSKSTVSFDQLFETKGSSENHLSHLYSDVWSSEVRTLCSWSRCLFWFIFVAVFHYWGDGNMKS